MHLDQLASFASRGTIVPLDNLAEALELTEEDFTPAVWQGGVFQGQRYGIPLDMFTVAQYWSTEVLTAAGLEIGPTTGEEFDSAIEALQSSGMENPFWVSPDNWQIFVSLLGQFGRFPLLRGPHHRRLRRRCRAQGAHLDARSRGGRRQPVRRHRSLNRLQKRILRDHRRAAVADQRHRGHHGRHGLRHRRFPDDRRLPGGLRELAQLHAHQAGRRRRGSRAGSPGIHRLDERELRDLGRFGEHPGPGIRSTRTRRSPTAGRPIWRPRRSSTASCSSSRFPAPVRSRQTVINVRSARQSSATKSPKRRSRPQ